METKDIKIIKLGPLSIGLKKRKKDPEIEAINQAVIEFKKAVIEEMGKSLSWLVEKIRKFLKWLFN